MVSYRFFFVERLWSCLAVELLSCYTVSSWEIPANKDLKILRLKDFKIYRLSTSLLKVSSFGWKEWKTGFAFHFLKSNDSLPWGLRSGYGCYGRRCCLAKHHSLAMSCPNRLRNKRFSTFAKLKLHFCFFWE